MGGRGASSGIYITRTKQSLGMQSRARKKEDDALFYSSIPNVQEIGNLSHKRALEKEFGKLNNTEVVLTSERAKHIIEQHPEAYSDIIRYGKSIIARPDYIVKDITNDKTIFLVKNLKDKNLRLVVRLSVGNNESGNSNSIITGQRMRKRTLESMLRKHKVLYKKEVK